MRIPPGSTAAIALCACAVLAPDAAGATSACAATMRLAARDARIRSAIDEARRQHRLFGGQTIERNGGMFRLGYHEAEWSHGPGESTPAWQRVAAFWQALAESEPPLLRTSEGWVARAEAARDATAAAGESRSTQAAVREALLRAAIVDTPWSAAFISYVMKAAGFSRDEFAFSDSHADYVQAAFATSAAEAAGGDTPSLYRACDAASTRPRAGDLLCATRADTAGVVRFDALAAAMASRTPGTPFPMHCELVVRSDEGGDAKLESIGGNVIQSVTLSRMTLNANKVLSDAYITHAALPRDCPGGAPRCRGHLTRRPWSLVLQFRR